MSELKKVAHVSLDRRGFLKASAWSVGGIGLMSLLEACGAGSSSPPTTGGGSTAVLNMPFLEDMQVPDPDIMYEGEGVQVMHAVYDGLAQYKPGTNEPIPLLAQSWEISEDQLTYTFKLRPNVKFHDGTIADAASWVAGFKRRAAINQGPAYMVAGIKEAVAKDPTTLVVHLKSPNNAFLHYLACPWHPFAVSPTAVAKHAAGGDLAQKWLQTHDAGTGAYTIKEFVPGNYYLLEKFPGYWGGDVAYDQIRITITPSVSTQELQLQQGQFDLITKGLPVPDVLKYQKNPAYEVPVALGGTGNAIWINPNRPMFADKTLRQALVKAINRDPIVKTSYGGLVPTQKGFWIDLLFPPDLDPITDTFDTAPLQALVAKLPDKNVDLAWGADGGAPVQQMAELVQTQLAAVGLNATVRQLPTAQVFDLANQPQSKRPDLFIDWIGGDALHLDTVLRIMLRTGAKPLNLFSFSYPELDKLMDEAILQPTTAKMNDVYVQATKFVMDEAIFVPFCAQPFPIIARNYLTGIAQDSDFPEIFDAGKIGRKLA